MGQCTKIVLLVISELPRQLTAKQLIKPSDFRLNVIAKVWNQNCLIRAYYLLFAILTPYKSYLMVFLKSYLRRNHLFVRNFDRYREVLSVMWSNFTLVKYNYKISNIYHQIKFWKIIMNRSSIKKLFLKILQYSHKNSCVGVSF